MNKKGFITDFLPDFVALGAYAVIFILFFILFTIQFTGFWENLRPKDQYPRRFDLTSSYAKSGEMDIDLINLLRTTVEIEGENIMIAELLAQSIMEDNYETFDSTIKELLGNYNKLTGKGCSQLTVIYGKSILKTTLTESCKEKPLTTKQIMNADFGKVNIPKFYSDLHDKVEVILVTGGKDE